MKLAIRDASPDDAEAVAELLGQLGYAVSAEEARGRIRRLSESDVDRLVVAEADGTVAGLAAVHVSLTLEYEAPAAKLSALVVDERQRRRGIGEALVQAMVAEAQRRRCCLIFLTTAERRAGAHAFYSRVGFEETGRRFAKRLD